MTSTDTRRVTLSERKINTLGRAYLAEFVGMRVEWTLWDGTVREGVVEIDTRDAKRGRPYGRYLLVRFADGTFARTSNDLRVIES